MKRATLSNVIGLVILCLSTSGRAQDCPGQWAEGFDLRGVQGQVLAQIIFDDGTGPAVYIGGSFRAAGAAVASGVAKWNGQTWAPVGGGLVDDVYALAVYDDGSGPALYAGGWISVNPGEDPCFLARLDGSEWTPIPGPDNRVRTLAVFDPDGPGREAPALYAGGDFEKAAGVNASHIAKWNGQQWSALGSGLNGIAVTMAVFDDDSTGPGKPGLYVGGGFTKAGAVSTRALARWSGTNWAAPVGGGPNEGGRVEELRALGGRTGLPTELYVGGRFDHIGGIAASGIARWNGQAWSNLGSGIESYVESIEEYDPDGLGPQPSAIYAGGSFDQAGGVTAYNMARWDGQAWSGLGAGTVGDIYSLLSADPDGDGIPTLHAAGYFKKAGAHAVSSFALWNGSKWAGTGGAEGLSARVDALAVFDDGTGVGPALYASGDLYTAGGAVVLGIARFHDGAWQPVGGGLTNWWNGQLERIRAMTTFNDPVHGPGLYAAGAFTKAGGTVINNNIARWDGASWSPVGNEYDNKGFLSLEVIDDGTGPALFAARGSGVARWNGAKWSWLGGEFNSDVRAVAGYDADGAGPQPAAVYAAGDFTLNNGKSIRRIARWDGAAWNAMGLGTDRAIESLASYDRDGDGPAKPVLLVGGTFTKASALTTTGIAGWNGTNWIAVAGAGVAGPGTPGVFALTSRDADGAGPGLPTLYAGGWFDSVAGVPASSIARWDGQTWSAVTEGITDPFPGGAAVYALASADDTATPGLYAGGGFSRAGAFASANIARWECGVPPCAADLNGDGALDLFDFLAFNNLFNAGDAAADCDHSGILDLFDFLCYVNSFNQGC